MAPLSSLQNCQVTKSNKTYTLREFPKRFAKDRMRLHKLSRLLERDSQSVFFHTKQKKGRKKKNKLRSPKEERMS